VFFFFQNVLTGHGAHPASYSMGTESYAGDKAAVRDTEHLPPPNAEVKNEWSYTSTPLVHFHGMDRGNCNIFTFLNSLP
jgi:hypothetical protein